MIAIDVKFGLQGTIREDRQTHSFVSYCPTLSLYSAGQSRIDAKKALTAAVDTYVRLCFERGILEKMLMKKGFLEAQAGSVGRTANDQFIAVGEYADEYDDVFVFDVQLPLVAERRVRGRSQ